MEIPSHYGDDYKDFSLHITGRIVELDISRPRVLAIMQRQLGEVLDASCRTLHVQDALYLSKEQHPHFRYEPPDNKEHYVVSFFATAQSRGTFRRSQQPAPSTEAEPMNMTFSRAEAEANLQLTRLRSVPPPSCHKLPWTEPIRKGSRLHVGCEVVHAQHGHGRVAEVRKCANAFYCFETSEAGRLQLQSCLRNAFWKLEPARNQIFGSAANKVIEQMEALLGISELRALTEPEGFDFASATGSRWRDIVEFTRTAR